MAKYQTTVHLEDSTNQSKRLSGELKISCALPLDAETATRAIGEALGFLKEEKIAPDVSRLAEAIERVRPGWKVTCVNVFPLTVEIGGTL